METLVQRLLLRPRGWWRRCESSTGWLRAHRGALNGRDVVPIFRTHTGFWRLQVPPALKLRRLRPLPLSPAGFPLPGRSAWRVCGSKAETQLVPFLTLWAPHPLTVPFGPVLSSCSEGEASMMTREWIRKEGTVALSPRFFTTELRRAPLLPPGLSVSASGKW